MISYSLCMNLQKPNALLFYKTCIFELKPNFFFTVIKTWPNSLPFKNDFRLHLINKINKFLTDKFKF